MGRDERLLIASIAVLALIAAIVLAYQHGVLWSSSTDNSGGGESSEVPSLPRLVGNDTVSGTYSYIVYNGSLTHIPPNRVPVSEYQNFSVNDYVDPVLPLVVGNSSDAIRRAAGFLGRILVMPRGHYIVSAYMEVYSPDRYAFRDRYVALGDMRVRIITAAWRVDIGFMHGGYWVDASIDVDAYTGAVTGFYIHTVMVAGKHSGAGDQWLIERINGSSILLLGRGASMKDILGRIRLVMREMGVNGSGYGVFVLRDYTGDPGKEMRIRFAHTYNGVPVSTMGIYASYLGFDTPDTMEAFIANYTIAGLYTRCILPVEKIGVYNGTVKTKWDAVDAVERFLAEKIPDPMRYLSFESVDKVYMYRVSRGEYVPVYVVYYRVKAADEKEAWIYAVAVDAASEEILWAQLYSVVVMRQ